VADQPRSANVVATSSEVADSARRSLLGHRGLTVWFTGLSGSGKSTVAYAVEQALMADGVATTVLDGDNLRTGINGDLGFSAQDRAEAVRRTGEVCRLMQQAGLVVLASLVSPFQADRDEVRARHGDGQFVEVFVDTPIEICEARDPKKLYARARAGEIPEFTGISSPYEAPLRPEVVVDTQQPLEECVAAVRAAINTAITIDRS